MASSTVSRTSSWRDLHCGELRPEHVGRRLTVSGWADTRRDHGGLVFVDLRDHTGLVQLVVNPEHAPEAATAAHEIRNEFVLRAEGEVVPRAPEAVNPNLPTGEVELRVERLEIVSRSTPLPFQLDEENVDETLRLRYRWLDLRRGQMQRNLRVSHVAIAAIRRVMDELGFIDVWTPSMTRGTPEGARDFLVPVRLQPGKFFALAQSPQLFKQLCMIGGVDRYYQIATCWRDEDLRADRQFEFRQLDLEMAFVEREDVLEVLEQCVVGAFEAAGREPPPRPFPRMPYAEAMARYGTDKPDLRFGLEIEDVTEVTRGSEFGVFAGAETVRYLVAPQAFSRAELARLEEVAKEWGAKGLAYLVRDEGGEVRSPIAKFLSERELEAFAADPGTTVLFAAADEATVTRVLGGLRTHLGRELGLAAGAGDAFHWVVDFPLFERDEDSGNWTFLHHPFTAPVAGDEEKVSADPGGALSQHYDLIWNGWELGSGSIRIHRAELQRAVFTTMGMSDEEAKAKFGFLLDALAMGAPPHGGFAMGIDRFVALLAGEPNIREVVAFPKVSSGADPLSGAPTAMPDSVLADLGIAVRAVRD
jgi:aspartyl-tRNA synthetase